MREILMCSDISLMGISSPVIGETTNFVGSLSAGVLSSGLFQFLTIRIGGSSSSIAAFTSFFLSSPFPSRLAAFIPSSTYCISSSSISISTTFPGSTNSSSSIAETLLLLMTSSRVIGIGSSSSSSSAKSILSTTTKSCQSIIAIWILSCSISSSAFCLACSCDFSHSSLCKHRSSTVVRSATLFLSLSVKPFGGINTFEYASARAVKNMNILWVGLRKWN
uniref:Uncharacterized protein n=1 Tax=Opuntia streptacantha TaxID=393608 RepID=A0A7C8ZU60_OPUST